MKTFKYSLYIIVALITSQLFTGCNEPVDNNVISIKIRGQENTTFLKEFAQIECEVHLENSEAAVFTYANNLDIIDDEIYIYNSQSGVLVFDLNGVFIRKIGRIGKGPNEIIVPHDVVFDKVNRWVEFFDFERNKILTYDFQGNFVRDAAFPIEYRTNNFYKFSNDKYLFDTGLSFDKSSPYSMHYGTLDSLVPFFTFTEQQLIDGNLRHGRKYLSPYKRGLLYWEMFDDNIYYIVKDRVETIFSVDFGDKALSADIKRMDLMERLMKINSEPDNYCAAINNVMGFDKAIIFSFVTSNGQVFTYYNTDTKEVHRIDGSPFGTMSLFKIDDNSFAAIGYLDDQNPTQSMMIRIFKLL